MAHHFIRTTAAVAATAALALGMVDPVEAAPDPRPGLRADLTVNAMPTPSPRTGTPSLEPPAMS